MTTRSNAEFSPIPKRKRNEVRISSSIRISARVWLYAKERYNIPLTIEETFKEYLRRDGVDTSIPHDREVVGTDEYGKPMTFAAAKQYGLMDKRGTWVPNPGVADEPEGAIL